MKLTFNYRLAGDWKDKLLLTYHNIPSIQDRNIELCNRIKYELGSHIYTHFNIFTGLISISWLGTDFIRDIINVLKGLGFASIIVDGGYLRVSIEEAIKVFPDWRKSLLERNKVYYIYRALEDKIVNFFGQGIYINLRDYPQILRIVCLDDQESAVHDWLIENDIPIVDIQYSANLDAGVITVPLM